jgi:hypothetical protein
MIIGINGYSGSGKDTVGNIIQRLTAKESYGYLEKTWEIKKFAGKLKTIASMITGIPEFKFEDQEFKKTDLGPEWGMTARDFLQKLGTEALRDGLHPNAWVNALMADYKLAANKFIRLTEDGLEEWEEGKLPNWIITDVRFPNEAQAIKNLDGIIIRIDRPGVSAVNAHSSETVIDDWNFDYKIANVSDLKALFLSVHSILIKEKII